MRLSAPKNIIFIISVVLMLVGLIARLVPGLPDVINVNSYWITLAGGVLLSIGCLLKGV